MSYDIYLRINTGKEETTVVDVGNMTSNVGKMYREAFPEGYGALHGIHGQKAADAGPMVQLAILAMTQDPAKYKLLNPPNGWGKYEDALEYLNRLYEACEDHPACTVYLSA